MAGQDFDQRRLVLRLQQVLDGARGEHRESFIGRREDSERPCPLKRLHQTGGLDGGNQRRMVFGVDGVLNDVLGRIHRSAADRDGLLLHHLCERGGSGAEREGCGESSKHKAGILHAARSD